MEGEAKNVVAEQGKAIHREIPCVSVSPGMCQKVYVKEQAPAMGLIK